MDATVISESFINNSVRYTETESIRSSKADLSLENIEPENIDKELIYSSTLQ